MPLISERFSDDGVPILVLTELQKKYIDIFRKKCSSGEYKFKKRTCECGSNDFEIIARKDRYGIPIDTVICRNCGLIMTNPCLDDYSNNSFYDNEYPFIYRAEEAPSEEVFLERKKAAVGIISFIRKHSGILSGKVLEIGCADGRNVAAFAESGYDAFGIDLSHAYVEFGKKKGLNLFCVDAASFVEKGLKFDIIVLNHVLEHFINLERELDVIKKMMTPDGFLFVAVPGIKALTFGVYDSDFLKLLQNAHIYNFTKSTLCSVMGRHGFSCVFCNEIIYSIFKNTEGQASYPNAYTDTRGYLKRLEEAAGDIRTLLIKRFQDIIGSFDVGEVLLYGTAIELDAIIQKIDSTAPIKGFFYSDSKTPEEVMFFIRLSGKSVKCLVIADNRQNDVLLEKYSDLIRDNEIELVSVYSELF